MHTGFLTKPKESAECHLTLSSRVGSGHETIVLTQVDVPCGHPCASPRGTASGWLHSVGGTPRSPLAQQTPATHEDNFKLVKSFVHIGETLFVLSSMSIARSKQKQTNHNQQKQTNHNQQKQTNDNQRRCSKCHRVSEYQSICILFLVHKLLFTLIPIDSHNARDCKIKFLPSPIPLLL